MQTTHVEGGLVKATGCPCKVLVSLADEGPDPTFDICPKHSPKGIEASDFEAADLWRVELLESATITLYQWLDLEMKKARRPNPGPISRLISPSLQAGKKGFLGRFLWRRQ
jgi:hypothetical protein